LGFVTAAIISGLSAALISYHLNAKALKTFGKRAISYGAPIVEELLKTGLAVLLGGDIMASHVTFGTAEAFYDLSKNRGASSVYACIAGFFSHALFGVITVYVAKVTSQVLCGIAVSAAVHMLWNYAVMEISQ